LRRRGAESSGIDSYQYSQKVPDNLVAGYTGYPAEFKKSTLKFQEKGSENIFPG